MSLLFCCCVSAGAINEDLLVSDKPRNQQLVEKVLNLSLYAYAGNDLLHKNVSFSAPGRLSLKLPIGALQILAVRGAYAVREPFAVTKKGPFA